jgi:hypothetical protein
MDHLNLDVIEKLNIFYDHMAGESTALGVLEPDTAAYQLRIGHYTQNTLFFIKLWGNSIQPSIRANI